VFKKLFFVGLSIIFSLQFVNAATLNGAVELSGEIEGARTAFAFRRTGTERCSFTDTLPRPSRSSGEVDNRNADLAPNAALEPVLLAQGTPCPVRLIKITAGRLTKAFRIEKSRRFFPRKRRSTAAYDSLGGFDGTVIGFKSMGAIRRHIRRGFVRLRVGAGASSSWDGAGDLALAYNTVFTMPAAWGTFGDVRDDIDFETEVQPKLLSEVSNMANFPKFEFIRLVTGTPGRGITPPANFYPNWIFTDMFFSMEARAELERRAGGPIVQNLDRNYNLTATERAYLNSRGLSSATIDNWLATMNAGRVVSASPSARNYVEHNADYSGKIKNPVLTMHTIIDPLVTVSQENRYAQTVAEAGRSRLLFQTYTNGNGHCNFTGTQLVTAVNAINDWVRTGTRPTQANFPAAAGFVPNFVAPPMTQP
jgi:hypothetical protein